MWLRAEVIRRPITWYCRVGGLEPLLTSCVCPEVSRMLACSGPPLVRSLPCTLRVWGRECGRRMDGWRPGACRGHGASSRATTGGGGRQRTLLPLLASVL